MFPYASQLHLRLVRANGKPPVRPDEMAGIAGGNPLEIILMLGFRFPEIACRNDLGDDLTRPQPGSIHVGDRILGDPLLPVAGMEYRRSIAGTDVVALAIACARIMDLEEELENPPIADARRVKVDFDGFGMPGMITIGGVRYGAAGVTHSCRQDAVHAADEFLHAPEATACQNRSFLGHWIFSIY